MSTDILARLFLIIGNQASVIPKLDVLKAFGVVAIYAASFSFPFISCFSVKRIAALSY